MPIRFHPSRMHEEVSVSLTLIEWYRIQRTLENLSAMDSAEHQAKSDAIDLLEAAISRAAGLNSDRRWI